MPQSTLDAILDHVGFDHRREQDALFEHLLTADERGVIAQAGTGTGKSLAVLAAAVQKRHDTGLPSLVVVPTNILLDQYAGKDAPTAAAALDVEIVSLKGRSHYLCSSGPGHRFDPKPELSALLRSDDIVEVEDPQYGCPGSDECSKVQCHYGKAKELLDGADVIVTNAHLFIIDAQMKAAPDGEDGPPPGIFGELGAVFVDESHTLEGVARGFVERSLAVATLETMRPAADKTLELLESWSKTVETASSPRRALDPWIKMALTDLARWRPPADVEKPKQRQFDAARGAAAILDTFARGSYDRGDDVLWFEPPFGNKKGRLVSTAVNLAGMMGSILPRTPFALVSATVPSTMAMCLGVRAARFVDVGHPFDYSRQATIAFSPLAGDFRSSKAPENFAGRAHWLRDAVLGSGGGALLLFSSYRDLDRVYDAIAPALRAAGLRVLRQERECDKKALGQAFKDDGNAVLFGTSSFSTGFDVAGSALRLLGVWKVPYPGLDPVTKAISSTSFNRYRDMALVELVQAIGRLIRTTSDTGEVRIADAKAAPLLLNPADPLVRHISQMNRLQEV